MERDRRQFKKLERCFIDRFFDNELLASAGDARDTLVHIVALLAALGMCVSFMLLRKHSFALSEVPFALRDALAWTDKEFLISITMGVTAVLAIINWEALFPDMRDCLILGALPVRPRVMAAAKLAALSRVFGIAFAAVNFFPAVFFPFFVLPPDAGYSGYTRYLFAHISVLAAAGVFVLFGFIGLQGLMTNALSYRQFKRVSAYVQLLLLFGVLFLFSMMPDIATPDRLSEPPNRRLAAMLPSFWFLGLYQVLLGSDAPIAHWLAGIAWRGLAICASLAMLLYWAGFATYIRKTVEESGAVQQEKRGGPGPLGALLDRWVLKYARERAVFWFVWRTMSRNRMHRLLLAAYMGAGVAYVVSGLAYAVKRGGSQALFRPSADTAAAAIVLSAFLLVGLRGLFPLPVDLRANWAFQLTEVPGARSLYLRGVRKLMFALGIIPVCAISFPIYAALWGWPAALRYLVLAFVIAWILLEALMGGFRKIPFTCSFLPGKANLKARFGAFAMLFVFISLIVSTILASVAREGGRFARALMFFGVLLVVMVLRRRAKEAAPGRFIYEEKPDWQTISIQVWS
jgi:hypothetical protein